MAHAYTPMSLLKRKIFFGTHVHRFGIPKIASLILHCCILITITVPALARPEINNSFDSPVIIDSEPMPEFPQKLLRRGIQTGHATLLLAVDQEGFLQDWLVVEATHVDLIVKIDEVVPLWSFQPPMVNGEPVDGVQRVPIFFNATHLNDATKDSPQKGRLMHRSRARNSRKGASHYSRNKPLRLATFEELDQYPEAIFQPQPIVSQSSLTESLSANVTFNFVIDTEGRVRMPTLYTINGDVDPQVIHAVNVALSQWRFRPLKSKNRPVTCEATKTFELGSLYAMAE